MENIVVNGELHRGTVLATRGEVSTMATEDSVGRKLAKKEASYLHRRRNFVACDGEGEPTV